MLATNVEKRLNKEKSNSDNPVGPTFSYEYSYNFLQSNTDNVGPALLCGVHRATSLGSDSEMTVFFLLLDSSLGHRSQGRLVKTDVVLSECDGFVCYYISSEINVGGNR